MSDAEREWSESASLALVFRSGAVRNVFSPRLPLCKSVYIKP